MPDGLPPLDGDSEATADLDAICDSVMVFMVAPFSDLVDDLKSRDGSRGVPPIACILADGFMNFVAGPTAERVGLPLVHLYTINACSLMAFKYCRSFLERGLASSIDGSSSERHAAERLVRELLGGEKGKELKRNAMEWKRLAAEATSPAGSSANNLEKLVKDVMLARA
ncbi:hypothetical protein MLD38_019704 [Melastoma candidum]|uniref:Uncharacterized protein n=1 Tax=Melastoma candidum TaxID=119954 RepID=A0ACB9QXC1_9MYRT|nr:hypothetical protein MLD38_019704 [Melastoma candidum]